MALGEEWFSVRIAADGALVPNGELDMTTVEELRFLVDEVMVPGRTIVLDLACLKFIDSNVIHWLVEVFEVTGTPVVLRNTPRAARILLDVAAIVGANGEAWVFEGVASKPLATE